MGNTIAEMGMKGKARGVQKAQLSSVPLLPAKPPVYDLRKHSSQVCVCVYMWVVCGVEEQHGAMLFASGMAHGKVEPWRCSWVLHTWQGKGCCGQGWQLLAGLSSHPGLQHCLLLPCASQEQSRSWPLERPSLSSLCFIPKGRISLDSTGGNTVNGKRIFLCQTPGP